MEKGNSVLVLTAAVLLMAFSAVAFAGTYSGGTGEPNDPYRIATAEDLNDIGNHTEDFDKHFVLVNDINLADYTGTQFNIIGNYEGYNDPNNKPFAGVFDGNGHSISNFTYESTGIYSTGLFSFLDGTNAEIKDLTLVEPNVSGVDLVGSFVGYLHYGIISNNVVKAGAVRGEYAVGGLVGANDYGLIFNCYSTANVNANDCTGGIAGANRSTMSNCYSAGKITGNLNTGGLAGRAWFCEIINSYAVSIVDGNENTGGLVGKIWTDSPMLLFNCYAAGDVSGNTNVGGLVGYAGSTDGIISNCYAMGNVSGKIQCIGGLVGANSGEVSNCYATGATDGNDYTGGLVGENWYGMISNSYAKGNVSGYVHTGGLIGWNYTGSISDCYTAGRVLGGQWYTGGLVGLNSYGKISNCYAIRDVSGTTDVGGLIGSNNKGTILASFWDIETGGPDNGIGIPLTTAQMQTESTFTDAGWDFVGETINGPNDIWTINEGEDYPKHVWKLVNFLGWYEVDLLDYSYFANHWLSTNCSDSNDCDGTDLDFSGDIDFSDLKIFCQHWLRGTQ